MSNNRQMFCAFLCLIGGITSIGWGQNEKGKSPAADQPSLVLEKPLKVEPNADEITRLCIERRNVAVESVKAAHAMFLGGKGDFESVVKAAELALEAQIDVPGSNKLQILEQHVQIFREFDKIVEDRFANGVGDVLTKNWAKYMRLDRELRLAREKMAAKKSA